MLKDRQYINVTKNQVFATDKGKVIIAAIGETILASPEMTAKWEQRLAEIGDGKTSPAGFMEQTKKLSAKIIEDAKNQVSDWDFSGIQLDSIQRAPSSLLSERKWARVSFAMEMLLIKVNFMDARTIRKANVHSLYLRKY